MTRYRLTLAQNLPGEEFSTADLHYTYRDGSENLWPVEDCDPKSNAAVVTGDIFDDLPTADVMSRKLVCLYKDGRAEEYSISSVQRIDTPELAATQYKVKIVLPQETVNTLTTGGYSLYGFKAVKTAVQGARPLVWFQTKKFGLQTDLLWQEDYEAYTSQTDIEEDATIIVTNSYKIDLGQTLEVTGDNGTGEVYSRGTAGAIDIQNQTTIRFTSGISQTPSGGGGAKPMCAFNIFNGFLNSMIPIAKVLLFFATTQVNTGTVIFSSYGPGILIDLSGVTQRDVNYALDSGWTWSGGTWASKVKAGTLIGPLLINNTHKTPPRAIS